MLPGAPSLTARHLAFQASSSSGVLRAHAAFTRSARKAFCSGVHLRAPPMRFPGDSLGFPLVAADILAARAANSLYRLIVEVICSVSPEISAGGVGTSDSNGITPPPVGLHAPNSASALMVSVPVAVQRCTRV